MTITANNSNIGEVYYGSQAISEIYYGSDLVWSNGVTLTVNPTPSHATVTFNTTGKISGNTIKVKKGTTVSYTVSCSGYYSASGSIAVNQNQSVNAILEKQIYVDDQVVFEKSAAGTYSVNIQAAGQYEIIAVGGGGGCGQMALGSVQYTVAVSASGGSGAVVQGVFRLSAGTISVTVGALGTSATIATAGTAASTDGSATTVGSICSVGGGGAGKAGWGNPVVQQGGVAGSVISYNSSALVSSTIISNGSAGTFSRWYTANRDGTISTSVVQSPYPPYGSGSAGSATTRYSGGASFTNSAGSAGYVKITYKGK